MLLDLEIEAEHWFVHAQVMPAKSSSVEGKDDRLRERRPFALVVPSMRRMGSMAVRVGVLYRARGARTAIGAVPMYIIMVV